MSEKSKSAIKSVIKFLLAAGIIAWLVSSGRFDLKTATALFQSPLVIVGFLLMGLNILLGSERWRALATSQGVKAGPAGVFKLTLVGTFFNYAMPGGVGGDVIKAYYFGKDHPNDRGAAMTSVLLDRVIGLYAMVAMAVVAMLCDAQHVFTNETLKSLFALMILLFISFTAGFFILFSRKLKEKKWLDALLNKLPMSQRLVNLYHITHRFGLFRMRLAAAFGLSILSQTVAIVFLWVAGQAAGFSDVGFGIYFLAAPLGYMATAIPISPAGVGVGQAAFSALFSLYLGHESLVGSSVITAQQVMTFIFGLFGVVIYLRRGEPVKT